VSDRELVQIEPSQFNRIDLLLETVTNALWEINDKLKPIDDAIDNQTLEITKWQSIQNESIIAGFALVAEAIAKLQTLPPPQPEQLEVKFVFKVADDHQDESFSIAISGVTDAEGQPIADQSGLTVAVASSDDSVVAVSFDPTTKSGSVSFGAPGVASLTATVTNKKGDILGSGAADFTVTTGDPAAVSDVKIAFSGVSEEPPVV
jgi:hypothetical protein